MARLARIESNLPLSKVVVHPEKTLEASRVIDFTVQKLQPDDLLSTQETAFLAQFGVPLQVWVDYFSRLLEDLQDYAYVTPDPEDILFEIELATQQIIDTEAIPTWQINATFCSILRKLINLNRTEGRRVTATGLSWRSYDTEPTFPRST